MSHMFGAWLEGISKKLKCLVLLGSSTIYWSVCLHMNDLVFEKKKNTLLCRSSTRLYTDSIHGLSFRSRMHMIWLWRLRNTRHGWPSLYSPRHMSGVLVFGLSVSRLCVACFLLKGCVLLC